MAQTTQPDKTKSELGLFIFPKEALIKHGIFSVKSKGGKRAIRVYPPWDLSCKIYNSQRIGMGKWGE